MHILFTVYKHILFIYLFLDILRVFYWYTPDSLSHGVNPILHPITKSVQGIFIFLFLCIYIYNYIFLFFTLFSLNFFFNFFIYFYFTFLIFNFFLNRCKTNVRSSVSIEKSFVLYFESRSVKC